MPEDLKISQVSLVSSVLGSDYLLLVRGSDNLIVTAADAGIGAAPPATGIAGTALSTSYASLSAAVAAIGSTPTRLFIVNALGSGASTTVPVTLTLEFIEGVGSIVLGSGDVVKVRSDVSNWPDAQVVSGAGTLSFDGNTVSRRFKAIWWGVKDDGLTTDVAATLNGITDRLFTDSVDGATLVLPPGQLLCSRALQDTGNSNAQWVLPKVSSNNKFTLSIEGTGLPNMACGTLLSGTILVSTLSSGNGFVIGCKNTADPGSLNRTLLNLGIKNLSVKLPANPTNSGIDLGYVVQPFVENLRIGTGEPYDAVAVQPTTTTSVGLVTPRNNVAGGQAIFRNVTVQGMRIGVEWNELGSLTNLSVANCYVGARVRDSHHWRLGRNWQFSHNNHHLIFDSNGDTGHAVIDLDLDVEDTTSSGNWWDLIADLKTIATDIARGELRWQRIDTNVGIVHSLTVSGALANLQRVERYAGGGSGSGRLIAIRDSATLANGQNNNVSIAGQSYITFTGPTAAYSVTGFDSQVEGAVLFAYFNSGQTLTLKHDNAGSSAGKRITIAGGADKTFAAGAAVRCIFVYDQSVGGGIGYWVLFSASDGTTAGF